MKSLFSGSCTALITPFLNNGEIDYETFGKLIEYQIENETKALVICGTTGEGSTLTVEEKLHLFDVAVKKARKRVPIIVGTGSNSTSFALNLAKEAEKREIDAHLIVTPYYNKASQKGIIEHYFALADNLRKPIIVYNVPSRTGVNISPETYSILSEHNNIIAVKEADTSIAKLIKSMYLTKDKLNFYVGNDDMITVGASLGCKGVISVLSNIAPRFTSEMAQTGIDGNIKASAQMQKQAIGLIEALFLDINPIPVKAAMKYLKICEDTMRLPLSSMNEHNKAELYNAIEKHRDIIY